MEYIIKKKNDDYLMHYGVKGMKCGVRKNLGKKAKIAANLERYATQYDANSTRATRKADKLAGRGNTEGAKIQREKAVSNAKLRNEMYKYRDTLVQDLSQKDINQGRRYVAKSAAIGALLAGPIGSVTAVSLDQARTQSYINEQRYGTKQERNGQKNIDRAIKKHTKIADAWANEGNERYATSNRDVVNSLKSIKKSDTSQYAKRRDLDDFILDQVASSLSRQDREKAKRR